jgi:Arc/MetJ family transcription regulator
MCEPMCDTLHMATNLAIDPQLLDEAVAVSGAGSKKQAVTLALQEFIAKRKQRRLLDLFGTLEWNAEFEYKRSRSR